ncbi:MAG: YdcF family protein [Marinibacterium profundimaris]|uniref:DUF218 domain-containing protein n=2 Tax=Marinibacterium profundimaris TaxID=1679460 RepID=A0A225NQQ2_9RHOB|nr:hypothetical protein ATO3_09390 [Marinibacterium profundimaris]
MDTLFFIASKLIGALLRADTWIVLLAAAGLIALLRDRRRGATRFTLVLLVYCLVIGFLPVGDVLLRPLENRYPTNPVLNDIDGIVVLGGAEDAFGTAHWDQVQLHDGAERFIAGAALARRFPEARLIFTGGNGLLRGLVQDNPSEASAAARAFDALGVPGDRVLLEGRSRNTAENAAFGLDLAQPEADETWVLVTSAFHMPRAMRSFDRAGWPAMIPFPVDYQTTTFGDRTRWNLAGHLSDLTVAVKEWVGLFAYGFTGR